jgi:AcrR family transcriptional regulator
MTVVQEPDRVAADEASTMERIRNSALKGFAAQGTSATSLRTVAAAAGVSLGLVQHHFATKAGLIKAVDDHVLALVLTSISQPIPEQTDSVAEIGSRVTRIIAEQTDIADYLGRALIDGSPLGASIFDALVGFGTARWNQRGERGETRPDIDLTWAAVNSLVLALGTVVLRAHIERHLPEPLTSPTQLQRWHASVNMLLREGLFRNDDRA